SLENAAILSVAGGLSFASHEHWDDDVREEVALHPERFGREVNNVLDAGGESYNQLAASGALYGLSLFLDHEPLHELSVDLLHALSIEIPLVIGLKHAFNSERPDGASKGFPSGHVASSFTVSAVVHENYGWAAALPAYVFSGLVGFHRIDTGNHDLSDVIFGAALGVVIGRTVGRNGSPSVEGLDLRPWTDPMSGARGIAVAGGF
ncbi:MAG: phosphatase PAP2 family protein, partial [Candidatus Binatia bacterium]